MKLILAALILVSLTACESLKDAKWSGGVSYNPATNEVSVTVGKSHIK